MNYSGKIMKEFVGLRAKIYSSLIGDGSEDKKAKDTKRCVIKRKIKIENIKNLNLATQLENKINHLEINKTDQYSLNKDHKKFVKKQ